MTQDNFAASVGRLRKALRREFEMRAATLEITAAQFVVLHRLWDGDGILISVLTKDASSDGGTITGVLDRLENKGLIRRERCEADRRVVRVWLTDAGRQLQAPLLEIIAQLNEKALRGLTPTQKKQLQDMLEKVGENLNA